MYTYIFRHYELLKTVQTKLILHSKYRLCRKRQLKTQIYSEVHRMEAATGTGWSKSLCAPDDYNTEGYKYCSKCPRASLQTFIDTPNCVLEDRVQYSTVHIPNVFCDGHLKIITCVGIVRIQSFSSDPREKIGRRKIRRSWRPNGFRNDSVRKHVVQECQRHTRCMRRSAILLKVGLVNFVSFNCAMKRDTILSQCRWELRVSEKKMGPTMHLREIPTQTPIFSSCSHLLSLILTTFSW